MKIVSLFFLCFPSFLLAVDGYTVTSGTYLDVEEFTICKNVKNTCSDSLFVPASNSTEWNDFISNHGSCASLLNCFLYLGFGGGDGYDILAEPFGGSSHDIYQDIVVDSTGSLIVAGWGYSATPTIDMLVVKYGYTGFAATGGRDTTFGGGDGIVLYQGANSTYGHAVAVDASNNIFVAGSDNNYATVWKYTSTGTLDTSFGTSGKFTESVANSKFHDIAIDTNGKIVLVGTKVDGGTSYNQAIWR